MRQHQRGRFRAAAGMLVVIAALAGCNGDEPNVDGTSQPTVSIERIGDPVELGDRETAFVASSPQRSDGSAVLIDEAVLAEPGYVAIYADGGGAPGRRIGVSEYLEAGGHTELVVELAEPLAEPALVHAMLHVEDSNNEVFEFPDHDAPVSEGSGIVVVSFMVEFADDEPSESTS